MRDGIIRPMEQDKLREMYHNLGQNLDNVKLVDYFSILGFAGLSVATYIMANVYALNGEFSISFRSAIASIFSGLTLKMTYQKAVKDIGKN